MTSPNAGLSVSPSGVVTTTGTLAAGGYTVSGTDANGLGDTGTWSYTLTVTAVTMTQVPRPPAPRRPPTRPASATSWRVTSSNGTVTFTATSPPAGASVSPPGR